MSTATRKSNKIAFSGSDPDYFRTSDVISYVEGITEEGFDVARGSPVGGKTGPVGFA
jgi:hypothetical protein